MGAVKQQNTATIGTSATKILTKTSTYSNSRRDVVVSNTHATIAIFVGGSGVTNTTGVKLAAGASLPFVLRASDELYAAAASASGSASVIG